MSKGLDRRRFVRDMAGVGVFTLGATGLLAVEGCKTSGGSQTLDEDRPRPKLAAAANAAVNVAVRQSAADPNNKSVALYSKAIAKMRATPFPRKIKDENGRLIQTDWWEAHALIHMNFCPHGNWFFVTWHRAYLTYFERVVRKFSGDPSFALPYWNWSADGHIPAAFWTDAELSHPIPNPNPRGYQPRDIGQADACDPKNVGKPVIDAIVNTNDFFSFAGGRAKAPRGPGGGTGQLEGVPHNSTHGFIGGDMGAFLSPRDPIFWMHHCNVDRLWAVWQARQVQRGRSTLPPAPPTVSLQKNLTSDWWLSQKLGTFYDENTGADAFMTVKDTQDIFNLKYKYDSAPTEFGLADDVAASSASIEPTLQRVVELQRNVEVDDAAKTVFFEIQRTPEVAEVLGRLKDRMSNPESTVPNIRFCADNVLIPQHPETSRLEFYVMYGADLGAERPTNIGSHSFFGHNHGAGDGNHTVSLIFDLLPPLKALAEAGHDLSVGTAPIQLLVRVVTDDEFPAHSLFDPIQLRVEYEEYG